MGTGEDHARVSVSKARGHDRESRLEAARLLGRLLACARAMLMGGVTVEPSALIMAMRPHWRERNLAGVYLRQTPAGWYAEVAFNNIPDGLAPMMGTPAHRPCASRAKALEQATGWLAMVLAADAGDLERRRAAPSKAGKRAFHLDGLVVHLEARTITIATRAATIARVSPACAEARLHLLLATDFPAGITEAGWSALHPSRRMLYMGWIGLLLAHGQTRFFRTSPGH